MRALQLNPNYGHPYIMSVAIPLKSCLESKAIDSKPGSGTCCRTEEAEGSLWRLNCVKSPHLARWPEQLPEACTKCSILDGDVRNMASTCWHSPRPLQQSLVLLVTRPRFVRYPGCPHTPVSHNHNYMAPKEQPSYGPAHMHSYHSSKHNMVLHIRPF